MAALDVSNIILKKFNLNDAFEGVPLIARFNTNPQQAKEEAEHVPGPGEETDPDITPDPDAVYFLATDFKRIKTEVKYPYRCTIEDTYYYVDEKGLTPLATFTLFLGKTDVNPISDDVDDEGIHTDTDEETGTVTIKNLSKLNSRESVALQALEALIRSMPNTNPETIPPVTIKLLAKKAFEFSSEFLSQSINLRTGTTEEGGGEGGEPDPEDPTVLPSIPSESLNSLAAVRKFGWCTQYPAQGEEGTFYIKLRTKTAEDE